MSLRNVNIKSRFKNKHLAMHLENKRNMGLSSEPIENNALYIIAT